MSKKEVMFFYTIFVLFLYCHGRSILQLQFCPTKICTFLGDHPNGKGGSPLFNRGIKVLDSLDWKGKQLVLVLCNPEDFSWFIPMTGIFRLKFSP